LHDRGRGSHEVLHVRSRVQLDDNAATAQVDQNLLASALQESDIRKPLKMLANLMPNVREIPSREIRAQTVL
jgi:hypothetical protein